MKILKGLILASVCASSILALQPMQKEAGWSGFLVLGGGHVEFENSEVAGNRLVEVEKKRIEHLGAPSSQSTAIPFVTGTVRYTLEDKKTEFFGGNSLEDYLRMDATLAVGVRHSFEGTGIIGVRLLASTSPTEVWEDPFLKNQNRVKTDRTSAGLGLKWEGIMDSNFEIDFRARSFDFDDKDYNGFSLIDNANAGSLVGDNGAHYINTAQAYSLQRKGAMASLEFLYTWKMNDNNLLIPAIKFTGDDRDGNARDNARSELALTYLFKNPNWLIATNLFVGESSYDKVNPVYLKKQDTDYVGGGVNITYNKLFGSENWGLNGGFFASQGDSDIDFYDTKIFLMSLGVAYKF